MDNEELGRAQAEFIRKYKFRMYRRTFLSIIISLFMLFGGVVLVMTYGISVNKVFGDGMSPSIEDGAYIFTNKLAFKNRLPKRGDIVISQGRIGRVIGIPGETVEIYGGHIYINNKMAQEMYIDETVLTYPYHGVEKFELDNTSYFLLTDARYSYQDSRDGTLANLGNIDGRVIASVKVEKAFPFLDKGEGSVSDERSTSR